MDYSFIALAVSVVVNIGLVAYMVTKDSSVNVAEALAEFKKAVIKVKAAKDKASVDGVALEVGIPQILQLLVNQAPKV